MLVSVKFSGCMNVFGQPSSPLSCTRLTILHSLDGAHQTPRFLLGPFICLELRLFLYYVLFSCSFEVYLESSRGSVSVV